MRFTVRRPASAEVSPCCHRPSGGDVACCVDVGVARPCAAGDALEDRLALAVFRRDVPALRASLRRVRCGNELEAPLGLVLEPGHQQSPALAADLPVESPFLRDVGTRAVTSTARRAGHGWHIQVLEADGVEAARHICGGLFHPIPTAIGLAGPQPRNRQLRSRPPMRAELRPRQPLLQPVHALDFPCAKTRNTQQLPARQRHRYRHAAIYSHNAAIPRARDRAGDSSKSNVPAPRSIQRDSIRLHRVGDGAGPSKAHPPDLGYPYLPIAAAELVEVVRLESDLPKSFMPAGLAPRRMAVGAVEKGAHCLGEIPQRLLLHSLRSCGQPVVFGAGRRQLRALLVITGRLTTRPPMLLLFHGQIPHKPGVTAMFGQRCRLHRAGKQPKPTHVNNLGMTTDTLSDPKDGRRRFLSQNQGFHTANMIDGAADERKASFDG